MKRIIEKQLISNSTIKPQIHLFTERFLNTIKSYPDFEEGVFPARGLQLLNLGVKIGFGFPSWNNFTKNSLNSSSSEGDLYLIDNTHFTDTILKTARHIKANYLPKMSEDDIKTALRTASIFMPKKVGGMPLTKAGRVLCYSLCENQLKLLKPSKVKVIVDGEECDGIMAGFSQSVNPKTGDVLKEFGRVYVKGKSMMLVEVSDMTAKNTFDVFSAYRAYEIGNYQELLEEISCSRTATSMPLGYKSVHLRIQEAKAAGKRTYCVIRKNLSNDTHEFELGGGFELDRLREQYHDTEQLIYIAR